MVSNKHRVQNLMNARKFHKENHFQVLVVLV